MSTQPLQQWTLFASKIFVIIIVLSESSPVEGQTNRLMAKMDWNPSSCAGNTCKFNDKINNMFSFSELQPPNGLSQPTNCRPPTTATSLSIPNEVRDDLNCIWYNSDGANEELWADAWNGDTDYRGGKCTGLDQPEFFRLVADTYRKYNPNKLMYEAGFKPPSVDRDVFLKSINNATGVSARIECNEDRLLTNVVVCMNPSYPYSLINCTYEASGCSGKLLLPTVTPGTVSPECSFFIPYTWAGPSATAPPSPTPTSPSPIVAPVATPSGGGVSIGMIVGIVVGCIALAGIGLASFMYVRKKKKANVEITTGTPVGGPMPPPYVVVDNTPFPTGVNVKGGAGMANMAPAQSGQLGSYPISDMSPPSTPASPYSQGSFGGVSTRRSASAGLVSDPLMQYIASTIINVSGASRGPLAAWQIRFEDLQIEESIGQGSFGRVYKANWNQTQVAVKVLLEGESGSESSLLPTASPTMARLEQEASLMSNLHHPNVVQFLGVCTYPAAVVTEFCARGSLNSVLQASYKSHERATDLSWPRRVGMAADAARGMIYLHSHSPPILHRDMKSANLLVTASWVVKVTDFNLSKIMAESSKSISNQPMNPRWLAPEVLMGGGAMLASDVFSFGVVLWELLTWQLPWGAANPWGITATITSGGRLPLPKADDLPGAGSGDWPKLGEYVALLQRCWAQEPGQRPTFQEIIQELRNIDLEATQM